MHSCERRLGLLRERDLAAPKEIVDQVERFESNLESYKSGHYNETQVRREFVDPFFKSLGWDIDNEEGFAEAYKDVIHEDAILSEQTNSFAAVFMFNYSLSIVREHLNCH